MAAPPQPESDSLGGGDSGSDGAQASSPAPRWPPRAPEAGSWAPCALTLVWRSLSSSSWVERAASQIRQSLGAACEYKECFSLYDKEQRGRIKATDLLVVMRCLGASPTPGEVQRHLQSHKIDRDGELDFSTFLTIMHMQIKQEDPKKEILLAMLMADKEKKGYIMASELRSKLMKLGEKLTHKEVDDLFKEANIEPNGKVKYDEFIHKITIPVWDH
uniref:Calmodulin-like protein 4 n=1 Tax=Canis lupus familiaris TaxID=9615 RepID=A0A8C0MVW5_CANLF